HVRFLGGRREATLESYPLNMVSETLFTDIISGKYDPTLDRIFRVIQQEAPQPILLRFAHEMELIDLYPWSKQDHQSYIAAYQYVVNYARTLGVDNLLWVWSPAGGNTNAIKYWPGNDYVDYVGITTLATEQWNSVNDEEVPSLRQILSEKYWVTKFSGKPMLIAEAGVNGTQQEKMQWLEESVATLPEFPRIRAFVYFNQEHPHIHLHRHDFNPDWSLDPNQIQRLVELW
ncbi:MAG: glycosyl hydrolase, partial [Halothece sp. Uz-M2-17]|nr:glycosyl hydrolase [Halothece sp. Uz-M2-17]